MLKSYGGKNKALNNSLLFCFSQRLGLSLFGAVAIAAIEGWLYWRVFSRVEQGKTEAEKWKTGGSEGARVGKVLKFE